MNCYIKSYSVENFLSIKNEIFLDFNKNQHKELFLTCNNASKPDINNVLGLFGNNGSGKSNILDSIEYLQYFISKQFIQSYKGLNDDISFAFDSISIKKPTTFKINFNIENIDYFYCLSVYKGTVIEESLHYAPQGRMKPLFIRNNEKTLIHLFNSKSQNDNFLKITNQLTSEDYPFLSSFSRFDVESINKPYLFFTRKIDFLFTTFHADEFLYKLDTQLIKNKKYKDLLISLLNSAGYSIIDFIVDTKTDILYYPLIGQYNNSNSNIDDLSSTIYSVYNIKDKIYNLNFLSESLGIKKLTILFQHIIKVFNEGGLIIIDEFGSSLSPETVKFIVRLFQDDEINKMNAQLLFSSQNSQLLRNTVLRRDQIFFVEFDQDKHYSRVIPLLTFSPRNTENYELNYLKGDYVSLNSADEMISKLKNKNK